MRDSLIKSLADSPDRQFERYVKGSIVLCNACGKPIYKLEAGLPLGQKMGRAAAMFKPLNAADLLELEDRADIDAGVRAAIKAMTADEKLAHLARLNEPKAGDAVICPACHGCFAQVLTVEQTETHDRAYVLEFLTIPPLGGGRPEPVRGKRIGASGDWIH